MDPQRRNKLIVRLLAGVVGAFAFSYALVPLYDVFCDITGLGGRTNDSAYQVESAEPDLDRTVRVRFLTTLSDSAIWEFGSVEPYVDVHPGKVYRVEFYAKNPTSRNTTSRAVPSVVPGQMARYLQKTECFCFEQQHLTAGESVVMPMVFQIDKSIPDYVDTITLNYTLYNIEPAQAGTH